jgi:hypothetical protein
MYSSRLSGQPNPSGGGEKELSAVINLYGKQT